MFARKAFFLAGLSFGRAAVFAAAELRPFSGTARGGRDDDPFLGRLRKRISFKGFSQNRPKTIGPPAFSLVWSGVEGVLAFCVA
ncbi:MAG TPA: hypothetical protein PK777_12955, partial [Thermoguttaceae bacterium]|nr:hypothetical protein [Thermoguttaceae bacterium]